MVKSIITIISAMAIFLCGAIFEQRYIDKSFEEFNKVSETVYEKLENETAIEDDILVLQKIWIKNKKHLHAFIPHTEIKEMDLWIAECVRFTKDGNYKEAVTKLEVIKELNEQIPNTFKLRFENVF